MIVLAAVLPALAAGAGVPQGAVPLPTPGVEYRVNEASPSRVPWINANGWRMQRSPAESYFYEAPDGVAALECAEAFAYGARAAVHATGAGQEAFRRMLDFLKTIPNADMPVLANIGVIDDGSAETGEMMNLLTRRNLLYRIVKAPDPKLDLNVRLGSPDYPRSEAASPDLLAHKIRAQLGDERRLARIYGSEVVIIRLTGTGNRARLHLINYASRPVNGLRVRVLGRWPQQHVMAYHHPDAHPEDVVVDNGATELTIREMSTYAVLDLSR